MKKSNTQKEAHTPQGTIVIMIIFVLLIITLWGSVFLTLLARGGTA